MEKIYGSPVRQDGLVKVGRHTYELIYGFGKDSADAETGWNWRQRFDHKPTTAEIRQVLEALINSNTDNKILTGFSWNGKPVYLSTENQSNFKNAYDFARDTSGATLPVKFKIGEDANGSPVYHTFTKFEVLQDFVLKASDFVNATLNEGWKEKDSIDYSLFDNG